MVLQHLSYTSNMKQFTCLFFITVIAALNREIRCEENTILGTVAGSGHSEFGGGSSQQHHSEVDGVVVSYSGYSNYEQKPDGSCIRRVVEVKNGVSSTNEFPIDCEQAKREIEEIAEKTRQRIERTQDEMNRKHEKTMREHYENLEKLQKKINEMQASFPKFK